MNVQYADTYFSTRLHAEAWEQATPDNKTKALTTAARHIDALDLPDSVPGDVVYQAICEQALWLLSEDDFQRKRAMDIARGVRGRSVSEASEYYAEEAVRAARSGAMIAPMAATLLSRWSVGQHTTVRGGMIV